MFIFEFKDICNGSLVDEDRLRKNHPSYQVALYKRWSSQLCQLLRLMLDLDPLKRLHFNVLLEHPWVKTLRV